MQSFLLRKSTKYKSLLTNIVLKLIYSNQCLQSLKTQSMKKLSDSYQKKYDIGKLLSL